MAHFNFENALSEAIKMDAPIQKGPTMRWQRKAMEAGIKSLSLDGGLNTSGLMGPRSSNSSCKTPTSKFCKTPISGRTPGTPGRVPLDRVKPLKGTPSRAGDTDILKSMGNKTPGQRGKTPSKSAPPSPKRCADRFIPNRSAMDLESSNYLLTSGENSDPNLQLSPSKTDYQKKMSSALNNGVPENSKILNFKDKAPQANEGYLNNLKVLYSASHSSTQKPAVTTRQIPKQPDRILDAPELMDDYYLNVLDWSSNNHLAIALGIGVYLWDASRGSITQLTELENQEEYISSLSWIKEGNILAVGNSMGVVQLYDVGAQKLIRSMPGHSARVGSLSWNSYILSSGSRSGVIHHHDVRVPEHHVGTLTSHTQEVCGLAWAPDGRYLASGANDNLLNIWDTNLGQQNAPIHALNQHQAAVKAISWCPWQSNLLASGGGTADRHIRFWNVATGACLNSVDTNSQVCSILWSPQYKELITGHGFSQFQLSIWKYPHMTKVTDLTGHTARVLSLSMSPDGTTVASAAADETLRFWKCFDVDKEKKTKKSTSTMSSKTSSFLGKSIR